MHHVRHPAKLRRAPVLASFGLSSPVFDLFVRSARVPPDFYSTHCTMFRRIIVVGGSGTIGSSTALHLARRGYTNVRVLDLYPAPSKISAGNDLNKVRYKICCWVHSAPCSSLIPRAQVAGSGREGIWGEMGRASAKAWKEDPLFSPHYHQTGTVSTVFLLCRLVVRSSDAWTPSRSWQRTPHWK